MAFVSGIKELPAIQTQSLRIFFNPKFRVHLKLNGNCYISSKRGHILYNLPPKAASTVSLFESFLFCCQNPDS
jgi:hypothetical protein